MCKKMIYLVSFVLVLGLVGHASAALPEGWQSQDIGTTSGSAAGSDGTWTISADGADIWWRSDQFHYAYVPLSGDGTIVARVVDNGTGSDAWAKGGVMIRETLEQDSKHAIMALTGGSSGGKAFQHRPITDQPSMSAHGGDPVAPPMWVKLTRVGNTFTGYYSTDGVTWEQQHDITLDPGPEASNPATIKMAADVYIGLFVTSHASGELRTYTFDSVSIETPRAMDNWEAAAAADAPGFLATNVPDGLYDIGAFSGDITYEFCVKSNPDETEASMCLIGRRQFGDTQAGLKFDQWNDTGEYGATLFGVVDLYYGVPYSGGVDTHLVFVSSEDAGTTTLYENGVNKGSVDAAITLFGLVGIGYGAQGEDASGSFNDFDGDIFGVAIYDTALSDDEIAAHSDAFFAPLSDVTVPGDIVQGVPNDGDWPHTYRLETPEMAIDDDIETKYLHFKGDFDPDPGTGGAGFQITPSAGPTIVSGLTLTTANDFPGRDPIAFELSGSNEGIDGPYELIASGDIVDFAQALAWPRLAMNATPISFGNYTAYAHYQLIFTAIRGPVGGSINSMQIAEVELLGVPAPAPAPGGANIILVTEAIDWDLDGLRDDHALETFLVSEGHNVDVRPDYWKVLTPEKITELNAADLIIFSRLAWSGHYIEGDEITQWNSLTTPLLQMNAYFARNTRWKWVNSDVRTPDGTQHIYAEAVDPYHPVFRGVLTVNDPAAPNGPLGVVEMIDPLVGTGLTSFIGGTDMGNGHLIAKLLEENMGWIAEWEAGVEFFEHSGQYSGGRRMLFCAGTQEIQYYDTEIQEVVTTAQGELNLTAEGLQMFRNAIDYLLGGVNIILVTEEIDFDWDGLRDDHSLESFLISEGHSVDVRPEYWNVLTPDKIAELNAADLIIVSRLAWSTRYNQDNEATEWNSLTTPLLQMNSHFARNIRWKWVNSGARAPDDTSYIYAEAVDPYHPVFRGVLTAPEPIDRYDGPMYIVEMVDPLIGTGFTAFIDGTDMGNGQLIANPVGLEMGWIAEWDTGVEFYEGAGQFAGGKRMLFCTGTFFDPDRQEVITRTQGELNLTAEGLQMFRNAIDYLLEPEFTDDKPNGRI